MTLTWLMAAGVGLSQQINQYTQFHLMEFVMNPAVAGNNPYFDARVNYRDQWRGITDAPRTYTLALHGPIWEDKMGLGGYVYADVLGPQRITSFQLSYAYHMNVTDKYKLSFGLSAGLLHWVIEGSKIELQSYNDIAWSNGYAPVLKPNFTTGIRFHGDNFYVGFSVPQVVGGKLRLYDDYANTPSELNRHYQVMGGYTYEINDDFTADAAAMGRYVMGINNFDFMGRAIYRDMVSLGVSYRSGFAQNSLSAIGIIAGYEFENNLMISYSYDIPVGKINGATSGSHEITLGMRFNRNNPAAGAGG